MDANQQVYDQEAASYQRLALQPAEPVLLGLLRGRWHAIDMLDLGVGAGRTAYTFAPIVRSYLGVDYSPNMIKLSRSRVAESERIRFEVGDARELSGYDAGRFDLVLFSFNGIDYVGHEDRLRVLAQIHRCLKQDGLFCFSAHSLCSVPFPASFPRLSLRKPVRSLYRFFREAPAVLQTRRINRQIDAPALRARGFAQLRDDAHNFQLVVYYTMPAFQVAQLEQSGFKVRAVYGLDGVEVSPSDPPNDAWLYYFCDKISA